MKRFSWQVILYTSALLFGVFGGSSTAWADDPYSPELGEVAYPLPGHIRTEAGTLLVHFRIDQPLDSAPGEEWYYPNDHYARFHVAWLRMNPHHYIGIYYRRATGAMWTTLELPDDDRNLTDPTGRSASWQQGEDHWVAYTWTRAGVHTFWLDGEIGQQLTRSNPEAGVGPIAYTGTLRLGSATHASPITVYGVHLLGRALSQEEMQQPVETLLQPMDGTFLLDRFGQQDFAPDGERETSAYSISGYLDETGGLATAATSFVETPQGRGLRLYRPPAVRPRVLIHVGAGINVARLGGMKNFLEANGYAVTVSSEWANRQLTLADREHLEGAYELMIFSREATAADFSDPSWNLVELPIVVSNPFIASGSWGWTQGQATAEPSTIYYDVEDAFHPVFHGIEKADSGRIAYREDAITLFTVISEEAGRLLLTQGSGSARYPALIFWDPGRLGDHLHPRIYFCFNFEQYLDSDNTSRTRNFFATNVDRLTDDGKTLLLNVLNRALDGEGSAMTFAGWREKHFSEIELADPIATGPHADFGGRGIPNLLRYALVLDAREPARADLPRPEVFRIVEEGTELDFLTLTYRRRTDAGDIVYRVEASGDLRNWQTLSSSRIVDVVPVEGGAVEEVTVADEIPVGEGGRRFLRLKVELLP